MQKHPMKIVAVLIGVTILAGLLARGQATKPAGDAPVVQNVTPAARQVLDDLRDAYAKLKSLELAGSVNLKYDAAGQKEDNKSDFTAAYQSPVNFRHEMKDDLLIVANADKAFAYKTDTKKYVTIDPLKDHVNPGDLPAPIGDALQQQNPSLMLALAKDAAAALTDGVGIVDRIEDVTLDGTKYQVLKFNSPGEETRVLINPQTHLLRQESIDLKQRLLDRGVPDVHTAMMTIDYSKTAADVPVELASFQWTPPADALLVKLQPEGAADGADGPALALMGKPAADFSLKDLSDKTITLAGLKGQVVVLDFWASWCGPCRESLPHLDALNAELAPKGLKVFAVNLQETKDVAQKFVDESKLKLPVLLDQDGKMAMSYKVEGIPQTVIIGKDGVISKVTIGYGPGSEDELKAAVLDAMK